VTCRAKIGPFFLMQHDPATSRADTCLARALEGCGRSLGELLEIHRSYLRWIVEVQMGRRLNARVSASDVVQETFLEANRDFAAFQGRSAQEFSGWLRRILLNNILRVVDEHVLAKKRDVRREVSLQALATSLDRSSARLEDMVPDAGPSPSVAVHRNDMATALADALADLPPDYRTVIVMRHIEELPFAEIAEQLGRSSGAVRMIWMRAIRATRMKLADSWHEE